MSPLLLFVIPNLGRWIRLRPAFLAICYAGLRSHHLACGVGALIYGSAVSR